MSSKATDSPTSIKREKPKGFNTRITGDIVGFYDVEVQGGLAVIPRAAKLNDGNIDATRPSMFILCETMEDVTVHEKDDKDPSKKVSVTAKKGEYIGIWAKSGMRHIRNCCGKEIWIEYSGEKNIGKQSPLKLYEISAKDNRPGTLIPIIEDKRVQSKDVATFLDVAPTTDEIQF